MTLSKKAILIKVLNTIAFGGSIAAKCMLTLHHGDDGTDKSTLITPAPYTFAIWLVVYTLLLGFNVYQWFPRATELVVDGVGFGHIIANAALATWMYAWSESLYGWQIATSSAVLALSLIHVYRSLRLHHTRSFIDSLLIKAPFAVYTGWAIFVFPINLLIAARGLNTPAVSVIFLVLVGGVSFHVVKYSKMHDWIFGSTVVWSLVGIAIAHSEDRSLVMLTATGFGGIVSAGILEIVVPRVYHNIRSYFPGHEDERRPLLPQ